MNQARQQGPQPIQQPRPQQPAPQAVPPPVQPRIQHQHQYVPQQPAQQPPLVHRHTFHEPGRDLRRHNPARYLGYRVFSKWVASDQTYFIVRKFPALNVRVILSLQDEIVKLEQELNTLDEDWSRERLPGGIQHPDPDTIHNGTFRQDDVQERTELIERLTKKLKNYNKYVNEYAKLARQPPARADDITNVQSWFDNHFGAIEELECEYIRREEELIAVQPKVRSWFRGILEMTRFLKIPCIKPCFTRKPYDYRIIDDGRGYWQNDKKVERFSTLTIAVVGLGMLIGPLWWLNFVTAPEKRLGIITGFIALFFVLVAVATTARVSDALAAAAAYSAVLMVFMQLGVGGH